MTDFGGRIGRLETIQKQLTCEHKNVKYVANDSLFMWPTHRFYKECKDCEKVFGFPDERSWLQDQKTHTQGRLNSISKEIKELDEKEDKK